MLNDAEVLAEAVSLLLAGDLDTAREHLATISWAKEPRPRPKFPITQPPPLLPKDQRAKNTVSRVEALTIYREDGWTCCYCGRLLVHPRAIELVSRQVPAGFPFESWHMPMSGRRTHPAIERICPNVDHLSPLARGGTNHRSNLRASCTPCNQAKGERTVEEFGFPVRPPARGSGWSGLEEHLAQLQTL